MSRYLALDWDVGEIRMVRGEVRGGRVRVTAVASLPIDSAGQDVWSSPAPLKSALATAVAQYDLRRAATLIAVRRELVQLQDLRLPPAPEDELPEMVRFLADKQFGAIAPDDAFDYLPLGIPRHVDAAQRRHGILDQNTATDSGSGAVSTSGGQTVLAALLASDRFHTILEVCRAVAVKPRSMTLSGLGTASLLVHASRNAPVRAELAVDLQKSAVEMTLIVEGRAVFMRTVRIPSGADAKPDVSYERHLEAEVRRTLAAAENRSECGVVERVTLLDSGDEHAGLATHLERELDIRLRRLDPLTTVDMAADVRQSLPGGADRFGPALGMLLDAASKRRPAIDWLSPRQAARKPDRYRPLVLAAVAVVLLASWLAVSTWRNVSRLNDQIDRASAQLQELDQMAQRLHEVERRVGPLDRWLASDIVWLDELYRLSDRFPPPEDAVLTQLQIVPRGDAVAMLLEGRVRNHQVVDRLETRLRDERHDVVPLMSNHESDQAPYFWQFKSTVAVVAVESDRRNPAGQAPAEVSGNRETTDERAAEGRVTDESPTDERAAEGRTDGETGVGEDSAGERPTDEEPPQ
ncbi:MAG: hypothetical protein ACC645_02120 [Pirellulales bacterium]